MKAKTLKISLLVVLGAMFSVHSYAQPGDPYYEHGNNSGGASVSELTDSVTVGDTLRYIVQPDANANTSYVWATMSGTLSSSFVWNAGSLGAFIGGTNTNDVTLRITGSVGTTDSLRVVEISASDCEAGDSTKISVQIINLPTALFGNGTNDNDSSFCYQNLGTNFTVPVSLTTDVQDGDVQYYVSVLNEASTEVWNNGGSAYSQDESVNTFNIPAAAFSAADTYTINISDVTDRISRKSGRSLGVDAGNSFTLLLYPQPSTGPLFHIPNM